MHTHTHLSQKPRKSHNKSLLSKLTKPTQSQTNYMPPVITVSPETFKKKQPNAKKYKSISKKENLNPKNRNTRQSDNDDTVASPFPLDPPAVARSPLARSGATARRAAVADPRRGRSLPSRRLGQQDAAVVCCLALAAKRCCFCRCRRCGDWLVREKLEDVFFRACRVNILQWF